MQSCGASRVRARYCVHANVSVWGVCGDTPSGGLVITYFRGHHRRGRTHWSVETYPWDAQKEFQSFETDSTFAIPLEPARAPPVRAAALPLSHSPALPLSPSPALPLSRSPALPLSGSPALPLSPSPALLFSSSSSLPLFLSLAPSRGRADIGWCTSRGLDDDDDGRRSGRRSGGGRSSVKSRAQLSCRQSGGGFHLCPQTHSSGGLATGSGSRRTFEIWMKPSLLLGS